MAKREWKSSSDDKREKKRHKVQANHGDRESNGAIDYPEDHKSPKSSIDFDSASGAEYIENQELKNLPEANISEFLKTNFISTEQSGDELRPIIDFKYLPTASNFARPVLSTFKSSTPIQAAAWPYAFAGRDIVGIAETGSGKTLAFGVPCVKATMDAVVASGAKKAKHAGIKSVIISPTRELAMQIHEQLRSVVRETDVRVVCVYGGASKDDQRVAMGKANIIVATPGRLIDFLDEGSVNIGQVKYLVLDEADRMLDKGFEDAIKKIIGLTSQHGRQTLMFTATWPISVQKIAASYMKTPVKIRIGADNPNGDLRANSQIQQSVEVIEPEVKQTRLVQLLKEHQSGKNKHNRILVFCLYKKEATRIENFIRGRGFPVAGIHGDLNQSQRTKSLEAFKTGEVPLLVATDVAARGLDIPEVKLVLNYTFPLTAEDYVHRIGRTGRAGKQGLAITLFTKHDKALSGALINVLRAAKQHVPEELMKFGTTVKRKTQDPYDIAYKIGDGNGQATKITFD